MPLPSSGFSRTSVSRHAHLRSSQPTRLGRCAGVDAGLGSLGQPESDVEFDQCDARWQPYLANERAIVLALHPSAVLRSRSSMLGNTPLLRHGTNPPSARPRRVISARLRGSMQCRPWRRTRARWRCQRRRPTVLRRAADLNPDQVGAGIGSTCLVVRVAGSALGVGSAGGCDSECGGNAAGHYVRERRRISLPNHASARVR